MGARINDESALADDQRVVLISLKARQTDRMWFSCACVLLLVASIQCGPVKKNAHIRREPSPEERAGLFGGDMDIKPSWSFRSAIKEQRNLWPNGVVPYTFSEKAKARFNETQLRNLTLAMEEYRKHTCITFVPWTNQMNYVLISIGNGCSSNVGMLTRYTRPGEEQKPNFQRLVLGQGCFNQGTLMHELMHAVGFYHEQMRWDRDDYVIIRSEYIRQGKLPQFRIYNEDRANKDLGAPYDYASIMHYPRHSFAEYEDEDTIVPIKPGVEIGQRRGFSQIDIWKLNKLYKCPGFDATLPPQVFTTPAQPVGGIKPTMPTKLKDGFYCNFDYGYSCGMRDTFESDFEWRRKEGKTLSTDTGPDADKSGDGGYLYTETTVRKPGQKAYVIMPYMVPVPRGCLKFWYNMNGETMGIFRIFSRDYEGHEKELFKLSGHQGNHWTRAIVPLSSDKPFEIVFEYEVTNDLGLGDMALDEVSTVTSLPSEMSCEKYGEIIP